MSLDPTTTTARLLALPSLREQAERDAKEHYIVTMRCHDPSGLHDSPTWEEMAETDEDPEDYTRTLLIDTFAALLADLTRWQSQAWALREIGRLAGFKTISDSVPTIRVIPDEKRAILVVECGPEAMCFNLPEITTRAAAIAAILLHLSESR